jgi:hypothetical protein
MEVGGGGLGEDIGIGPITTTRVGLLILVSQLSIQEYHQIGEVSTVNYHQFISALNSVSLVNIANITLMSL